jgi:hypothetical protein
MLFESDYGKVLVANIQFPALDSYNNNMMFKTSNIVFDITDANLGYPLVPFVTCQSSKSIMRR